MFAGNNESLVVPEVLLSPEEQERADLYGLLSALLLGPDGALVDALARLPRSDAPEDPLAVAWNALIAAAGHGAPAVLQEYESLFVAAGTPRVNPYQGFYLDGWLMDKPLAQLRDELRALGLARASGATELEDHLGALCETMRLLIERGAPLPVQQAFFSRHLAGWTTRCLDDIAAASDGGFYAALARFAQAFLELESVDETAPA